MGGELPDAILPNIIVAVMRNRRLFLQDQHGGSRPGKRPNRDLGRAEAARRLHVDYILPAHEQNPYGGVGPTFTDAEFERRLRINRRVYARVKFGVLECDSSFEQRRDAVGKLGASTDQKLRIALRLLGTGIGADSVVEVSRLSESTPANCLKNFSRAVVKQFGSKYLRLPSTTDLSLVEATYCKLGLPGCIGAVDCAG
jgi:hypothetical protein